MKKVLQFIMQEMKAAKVDYHFINRKSKPTYPYFVGELLPVDTDTEDGRREFTLILDGFNRKTASNNGTLFELLEEAEKIEQQFPSVEGNTAMLKQQAVAVYFCGCQAIDSGDEQIQKVQITLTIKTWKGGN